MTKICLKIILVLVFVCNLYAQNDFPVLRGEYLGQKPPGMTPEKFAPGVVTTNMNEHSPAAFSPDGKELFWSATDGRRFSLYHMKMVDGVWTRPDIPDFTKNLDCSTPVFTVDGRKLFFTTQVVENNNWYITLRYVEKIKKGWSYPKKVESISGFGSIGYQVSFTNNGTIYFCSEAKDGFGGKDIYKAKLENGEYSKFEILGPIINSKLSEQSVYIATDESYIIFRRHTRGQNDILMDFYISFKQNNGSWSKPICFTDKLNAKGDGFWIGLSPDQKYIFFIKKGIANNYTQRGSDLFWVDANIIEDLKPAELKKRRQK